jgi:hypothetical protein
MDQRFITDICCAVGTSPTEKFLVFANQIKNNWIMEDIKTSSEIIDKLDKLYKNMVHDGTWINTNEKDTKIVALTSSFQEIKKKVGELAKHVMFSVGGGDSRKGSGGKSKSPDGGANVGVYIHAGLLDAYLYA